MITGRFTLDRRIFRHCKKPYCDELAWIWLIAAANPVGDDRGKYHTSHGELSTAWGWSEPLVRAKLAEWEKPDGRLMVECLGADENEFVITLVNYDKYQSGDYSDDAGAKGRKKAPQKQTVIQAMLDEVKLRVFHAKYGERIDVDELWEQFTMINLYGTAKKPIPNPYGYNDMTLAFHQWCKKAPDKPKPKPDEPKFCYDLPVIGGSED